MNMAVGGNFGGPLADTLAFPQRLKVDYVRVYQAPQETEKFEATFTDDEAGWRFVQLPFADFARSAQQQEGAADDGFGRTAVTGYEIEVAGAPLPDATSLSLFAAPEGAVSLDKVQVLTEVTDPTTGGGGDGDGGGDGTGDGTGTGTGSTGGASGAQASGGAGGLATTGGVDVTPLAGLALLLLGLGALLMRRRRKTRAEH